MKNNVSVEAIEEILRDYFPKTCDKVTQAMEYSLFSGGKRIRPMLLLETAKAVGGRIRPYLFAYPRRSSLYGQRRLAPR